MSMNIYGLREAKSLIAAQRKTLSANFPRSSDPYIRAQHQALKQLDDTITQRIKAYQLTANPPARVA